MSQNLIFNICEQRRRQQLFPVPPVRAELESSPYNQLINGVIYSQRDVDMRRKAEILKYNSNKVSTQTNSLTKGQKFSLLVKGFTQQLANTTVQELSNGRACPNDALIPTPTSSSDIPGPIVLLINDETVPLYKYINPTYTRNYSTLPQNNTDPWTIISYENSSFSNANSFTNSMSTIYIRYLVDQPNTIFSLNIPIGIYALGDISNNSGSNINISISNVSLNVFYNDTNVTNSYNIQSPILVSNFSNLSFNVNNNSGLFNAIQYVGNLTTDNLNLYTTVGFIYDIKLSFVLNISPLGNISSDYLKTFDYGVYANLSSDKTNYARNCNITSSSPNTYSKFSMISKMSSVGTPPVIQQR